MDSNGILYTYAEYKYWLVSGILGKMSRGLVLGLNKGPRPTNKLIWPFLWGSQYNSRFITIHPTVGVETFHRKISWRVWKTQENTKVTKEIKNVF